MLVQDLNRYVAIAEEFPNSAAGQVKAGGLLHTRRVSRVVTPGTLIDENFMDDLSNNYVLAIHPLAHQNSFIPGALHQSIGLAWLDLSTGHFFTQCTSLVELSSLLARVGAREIVLDEKLKSNDSHGLFTVLGEDHPLITYASTDISKLASMSE